MRLLHARVYTRTHMKRGEIQKALPSREFRSVSWFFKQIIWDFGGDVKWASRSSGIFRYANGFGTLRAYTARTYTNSVCSEDINSEFERKLFITTFLAACILWTMHGD